MIHNVLIVEPDEAIRPLLERVFRRAYFRAITVSNLSGAFAALAANDFCFALIDCIPSEACLVTDVAAAHPELPIAVTATVPKYLRDLPEHGVRVFTKPYDISELVSAASEYCSVRPAVTASEPAPSSLGHTSG